MSEIMRLSACAFSLAEMLCDEMKARGWTTDDVGARMQVHGLQKDTLIFALLITISQRDDRLVITDDDYTGLARAFDVSADYFRNIHAAWCRQQQGRQPFSPSDAFFGPFTRAALDNGKRP